MRLPSWLSASGSNTSATLTGRWRRIRADKPDGDAGVLMDFMPDGQLRYTIDAGDREQIVLLTYRVEGNELVTDQPSRSRTERTRFSFEAPDVLLLDFEGEQTWFKRVSQAGGA